MNATWTVGDITALMESWYPKEWAESWDRVGLILGRQNAPIRKVLLAVDPVRAVVDQACANNVDMVITHHPLLIKGVSFLPEDDPKGSVVAELIRHDIALFNAHTNADCAPTGVAQALADLLGLCDAQPFTVVTHDDGGNPVGLGRIGRIEPTTLGAFADKVAQALPAGPTGLLVAGDEGQTITTIAVSGGSGDSFLDDARRLGADAYLTADLRHHPASEHVEAGKPALLSASHWATEWPWLPVLAQRLREEAHLQNVDLDVEVSTIVTEPWNSHRPTSGGNA
ncbi:Nif3-like dinuclear metal center hexameric protein [Schaalia vaccimaxillae]|uniref:Nif3-like dinuclear metal center hexameric protein n=1 Tax=Schaalia vaccimaxillae TaxID=183916 RepID=UPI0003B79130|nr:Nif3-like dinuclear metal center hexameric protein [Schaalia vaccimaxillae]